MKTKICSKCKQRKFITEFYKRSNRPCGFVSECKSCKTKTCYKSRQKHAVVYKDGNRYHRLVKQLNISRKELIKVYDKLFRLQNGKCAICNKSVNKLDSRLCIDHNHETLEIRGLLCSSCNFGIGYFKEDISLLKQWIAYLQM